MTAAHLLSTNTKKNVIFIFLASIPPLVYMLFLIRNISNTPFVDDYYDILLTLIKFHSSTTLPDKISALFWQHSQHYLVYDRVTYWLLDLFSQGTNFRLIAIIGNSWLVVLLIQLCREIPQKNLIIAPFISLILFNLYSDENAFWPMGALSQFSIMSFTMAAFQCVDRKKKNILMAAFWCWLAIFTQANEILIIPLVGIILLQDLLDSRLSKQEMRNLLCMALFMKFEVIQHLANNIPKSRSVDQNQIAREIIWSFFGSLGSLPFPGGEHPLKGAIIGALHLPLMLYLCVKGWRQNRAITLMLLFCLASLLSAAIMRTSIFGYTAYVSRYKIFLSTILCCEAILLTSISNRKSILTIIALLSISICTHSYIMHTQYISDYSKRRSKSLMKWLYTAEIMSNPLANAILDEAYARNIYNPARQINYPTIPQNIAETNSCLSSEKATLLPDISLTSTPGSRAVMIAVNSLDTQIQANDFAIWLCGSRNYKIDMRAVAIESIPTYRKQYELAILEKERFDSGQYSAYIQTESQLFVLPTAVDLAFTPITEWKDCTQHAGMLQHVFTGVNARYCKNTH